VAPGGKVVVVVVGGGGGVVVVVVGPARRKVVVGAAVVGGTVVVVVGGAVVEVVVVVGGRARKLLPMDKSTTGLGGATACQLSPPRGSAGSTSSNEDPRGTRMGWVGSVKAGGATGGIWVVALARSVDADRPDRAVDPQAATASDRPRAAASSAPAADRERRELEDWMPGSMPRRSRRPGATVTPADGSKKNQF
jgi:hypothetical protein